MENLHDYELTQQLVVRRRQVLRQMSDDVRWLIAQPADSWIWVSSQRDLVDLIHTVWLQQTITDDLVRPLSQAKLCQLAFAAVGLPMPSNVASIVRKVCNRSNERLSMLYRYEAMEDVSEMLHHFIKKRYHETK